MIDRTKPLTEQTAHDLRVYLDALHHNRESYRIAKRLVEMQSCDVDIADATQALAIINRRATEAEDQRVTEERNHLLSIRQLVVKANVGGLWSIELATLDRVIADPIASALTADEVRAMMREVALAMLEAPISKATATNVTLADAIAARVAEKLAGRVVSAEQRDRIVTIADEAFGLGPVEPLDATLTRLECGIHEQNRRLAELDAAVERMAPVVRATEGWVDNGPVAAGLVVAVQRYREKLAGRTEVMAQREADLRDAVMYGVALGWRNAVGDQRGLDDAAAEYARSKAGG